MNNFENCNIFNENIESLSSISIDKNSKTYMTNSLLKAVNFDKVKEQYSHDLEISQVPASCDAILRLSNNKFIFIEFKNGKISSEEKRDINLKLRDSLLLFCDILKCTVTDTRNLVEFILVYNAEKNNLNNKKISPYDDIVTKVGRYAAEEIIRFGFKKFQNLYFYKVHTYNETEFENYLEKIETSQ